VPPSEREDIKLLKEKKKEELSADRLTRQQINKCIMDIEDVHPLREMVDLVNLVPVLSWCYKKKRSEFKPTLRKLLLEELKVKIPKNESNL